jgi:catechol 2,3-dioxygenase-like lactoylglutathione lyase family enzyme
MKLFVNLFCRDIEAQLAFYRVLLNLPEDTRSRSPIYRAVESETFQFGFHASAAYGLLGLGNRVPEPGITAPVTGYATFMLDDPAAVEGATEQAVQLGGQVIKRPYATYYRQWQAVLADPEGHVFRLSTLGLPPGVAAPPAPAH